MGKYKNDPNIIRKADFLDPFFIKAKVWLKNNTPHIVTTTAESMPVIPNLAGNNPKGTKNNV